VWGKCAIIKELNRISIFSLNREMLHYPSKRRSFPVMWRKSVIRFSKDRLLDFYMNNNIKWAIYARKSTESEDKQIQSIDDQINYMQEIAKREGLNVIEVISESKSAKLKNNREGFSKLLSLIDTGKIQGILCWKMDRLSRNPVESAHIQEALQLRKLECIYTAERKYWPEDNALIFAVEQGMANQYSRDLSKGKFRKCNIINRCLCR
jgi:predicted site-specific integrase-resolvase